MKSDQPIGAGVHAAVAIALISLCVLLLLLPVALPVSSYHYDIFMYMDAEHRIRSGQVPHLDFFSPFGLLSLYGYAWAKATFPGAEPVLAAQYAIVPLAAFLLAWALASAKPPKWAAIVIWVFFVALALVPANFNRPWGTSGGDAFGIYNRQAGLLLYVLVTALWWPASKWTVTVIAVLLLLVLFALKITAFAAGLILVIGAALAARLDRRGILAGAVAVGVLVSVSLPVLHAYLNDIATMGKVAQQFAQLQLHRLITTLVENIGPVFLLLGVTATLLLGQFAAVRGQKFFVVRGGTWQFAQAIVRGPAVPFAVLSLLGLLVESQNTGSQALAFLLPAVLRMENLDEHLKLPAPMRSSLLFCVAGFCVLVGVNLVLGYGALATAQLSQHPITELQNWDMRLVGREADIRKARDMLILQGENPAYEERAAQLDVEMADSASPRTMIAYLLSLADAANSIRALQAAGERIELLATLDYVNPMPSLLGTPPIEGLPIVFAPDRTTSGPLRAQLRQQLLTADALLAPQCTVFPYSRDALETVASQLGDWRRLQLTPCWKIFLHDRPRQ